ASVVREIFSMYLRGLSILKIKQQLESRGIPSPTGKPAWSKHTIDTILDNKKYIGVSVIYKTYHTGHPESKRVLNRGTHDRYELNGHHIPIIPADLFEKVQSTRAERSNIELDEDGKPKRKSKKYSAAKIVLD
ncbi:MAG: recombinase family protein, partial [Bacteroidales bacterium]|nr:recombinase family protein [Bacteroidales bacterium]